MVFVIHWHESAMDLHIFPIPIPPPISLSTQPRLDAWDKCSGLVDWEDPEIDFITQTSKQTQVWLSNKATPCSKSSIDFLSRWVPKFLLWSILSGSYLLLWSYLSSLSFNSYILNFLIFTYSLKCYYVNKAFPDHNISNFSLTRKSTFTFLCYVFSNIFTIWWTVYFTYGFVMHFIPTSTAYHPFGM